MFVAPVELLEGQMEDVVVVFSNLRARKERAGGQVQKENRLNQKLSILVLQMLQNLKSLTLLFTKKILMFS